MLYNSYLKSLLTDSLMLAKHFLLYSLGWKLSFMSREMILINVFIAHAQIATIYKSLSARVIFKFSIIITCFTEQPLNHYYFVQENFGTFTYVFHFYCGKRLDFWTETSGLISSIICKRETWRAVSPCWYVEIHIYFCVYSEDKHFLVYVTFTLS